MESVQPKFMKASDLPKRYGYHKSKIYRWIDEIRKQGLFDEICIQPTPRATIVNIEKFDEWLKSQSMKWLKGA